MKNDASAIRLKCDWCGRYLGNSYYVVPKQVEYDYSFDPPEPPETENVCDECFTKAYGEADHA
jgi:hypothetical protein